MIPSLSSKGACEGSKDSRLPVARGHVAEEIRVEGRDDSCFHADTRRAIITGTAESTIILSRYDKTVLIGKSTGRAGWLDMCHQMLLFFGNPFSFLFLLSHVILVLCIQLDL